MLSSSPAAQLGRVLCAAALGFAAVMVVARPAEAQQCRVVEMQMTPTANLQIVAWVEDTAGNYVDTAYITNATGFYGIGNRPGILEFNSGPRWPYGRRETVFPVWAHRHGLTFPMVLFQTSAFANERDLSHPFDDSSVESHFCRPLKPDEVGWDTGSCPSTVYTDKGFLSPTQTSRYPMRSDARTKQTDDASVDMFRQLNPFDSVSRATPTGGVNTRLTWTTPQDMPAGNYVLWVEVSKEFDHNDSYTVADRPSPAVSYGDYGLPYRGQPSVVYKVPFTLGDSVFTAQTSDYVGYSERDGASGMLFAPDATISTNVPGSGASRLSLVPDGAGSYRVKVTARPELDTMAPGAIREPTVMTTDRNNVTVMFEAPGDDGGSGRVAEYEIRIRAGEAINDENFESSMPISTVLEPDDAGQMQMVTLTGLMAATRYYVGIRAVDDCRNAGPLTVIQLTTDDRKAGEVDACFVATAAYGSLMSNQVEMLRHFRDALLEQSVLGQLAVTAYYTFGPTVAGVVGESELLRATARTALEPVVSRVGKLRH